MIDEDMCMSMIIDVRMLVIIVALPLVAVRMLAAETPAPATPVRDNLSYTFGAHYDSLCLATGSAAVQYQTTPDQLAMFAQLSPGIHGAKISIGGGYDYAYGVCGPVRSSWVDAFLLVGKLTYCHLWAPPSHLGENRNLLGLEIEGGFVLSGSIGVFHALGPARSGSDWTAAWSLGIGL